MMLHSFNGVAQVEVFKNFISGTSVKMDSSFFVADDKFLLPAWGDIDSVYYSKGFLTFEIDPTVSTITADTFICTITLEVKMWDSTNTITTDTIDLTLHFDTTNNLAYSNGANYYFNDVYKFQTTVLSVYYHQGSGGVVPPPIFRLSSQISILRSYLPVCSTVSINFGSCYLDLIRSEYHVSWSQLSNVEVYDLEWTFFDDSSEVGKRILVNDFSLSLDSLWRDNSTRVTISNNNYSIPLIYDGGYLLYRVRGVSETPPFQRITFPWNTSYSNRIHINWHEPDLTWQTAVNFAELGKRKQVTSYFDGSLRNRQTVSKINSVDTSVVVETIYDYQGRPAVQILPTPTFNPQIRYFDKFNINSGGTPYNWQDFDTSGCGIYPGILLNDSGAARYYSSSNPLVNVAPFNYIPESSGYPFSVTEYTPDNTGRISRQSGVGPDLTLGTNHETKYFYGKPSQTELDRLFGNDAGDSSHYTQVLVIDPNGQGSISYKDLQGRVVATALTGQPPANLDTINEYLPDTIIRTYLLDNNHIENQSKLSNTAFLAKTDGTYTFNYSLFPQSLLLDNCDNDQLCYDCYYDIRIKISSTCSPDPYNNVPIAYKDYKNYQIPYNDTTFYFDTLCVNPDSLVLDTFQVNLEVGSYFISREITVSNDALTFYTNRFLEENTCNSFESYLSVELAGMDSSSCNLTCQTCLEQLGDSASFIERFFNSTDTSFHDWTANDTLNAYMIYNEAYQNCMLICNPFNICNIKRDMMMGDVSPGGQYFNYITDSSGDIFYSSDRSSVLFWDGVKASYSKIDYKDSQGNPIQVQTLNGVKSPSELTLSEFIDLFDDSWASSLLQLHPEYCYLKYCDENYASHEYDQNMINTDTYAAAVDSGYWYPLAPIGMDPYFNTLDGTGKLAALQTKMHSYKTVTVPIPYNQHCSSVTFSMWQLAVLTAVHGLPTNLDPCVDTLDINNLCVGDQNLAWMAFRAMYLREKERIFASRENYYAKNTCDLASPCGNYCVGGLINEYQSMGHGTSCSSSKFCNEDYFNKTPRFYHMNDNHPLNWKDTTEAYAWAASNNIDSICEATCRSYRSDWKIKLNQYCGNIDDLTMTTLLDRFQDICEHGCDMTHPMGSSTVPPGDLLSPGTFQEAIQQVLGVSSSNPTCNAVIISMPPPYPNSDIDSYSSTDVLYPKPSPCTCEKYDSLFSLMVATTGNYLIDSLAVFLAENYGSLLSTDQLNEIKIHCRDTLCKNISEAFELPQVLSCGECLPCDSVEQAIIKFHNEDSLAFAGPDGTTILAGYLNQYFGYHLTSTDYFQFMDACQRDTTFLFGSLNCEVISELFADYLSSSPTGSLDDYLNQELGLNFTYRDYAIWIYNCAFDTINNSFLSCGVVISARDQFYNTTVPADSFVWWMNTTLGLDYSYLHYAAWIANCDSTDSIPYATGVLPRIGSRGININQRRIQPKHAKGDSSTIKPTFEEKETSPDNIRKQYELIRKKRFEQLKSIQLDITPGKDRPAEGYFRFGDDQEHLQRSFNNETVNEFFVKDSQLSLKDIIYKKYQQNCNLAGSLSASLNSHQIIFDEIRYDKSESWETNVIQRLTSRQSLDTFADGLADQSSSGGGNGEGSGTAETALIPPSTNNTFSVNCSELDGALASYADYLANYGYCVPAYLFVNQVFADSNWNGIFTPSSLEFFAKLCNLDIPQCSPDCEEIEAVRAACGNNYSGLVDCLNSSFNLSFTIERYIEWFDSCNISMIPCEELSDTLDQYNCTGGKTITEYLRDCFQVSWSDVVWLKFLADCNIEISCFDCEDIKTQIESWTCTDGDIYLWLNQTNGLNYTVAEWNYLLKNCTELDSCALVACWLTDYQGEYCLENFDFIEYLQANSGWSLTDVQFVELLTRCDLHLCCDVLYAALEEYECNELTLAEYLNQTLNISLSDSAWIALIRSCELTIPCDCGSLPGTIEADCGWPVEGGAYLSYLQHNSSLSLSLVEFAEYFRLCEKTVDSCSFLNCWISVYACDLPSFFPWLNYISGWNLNSGQWEQLLEFCTLSNPCPTITCEQIGASLHTYPCNSQTISQYLNGQYTGLNYSSSQWIAILDSCNLELNSVECLPNCDSIQDLAQLYSCHYNTGFITWLNTYLGTHVGVDEWQYFIAHCDIDTICDTCLLLEPIVSSYPCDSISLKAWLDGQTGWSLSDSAWIKIITECSFESSWKTHCISCDSLQWYSELYPCNSGLTFFSWLNDTLNLAYSLAEWDSIVVTCPIDTTCDSCAFLSAEIMNYPCDSLSLKAWLDNRTGWNYSDTVWITMLDSCGLDSLWKNHCIACDSLQLYSGKYPCNSGLGFYAWLNDTLDLAYTDDEWASIISDCPMDSTCDSCAFLSDEIMNYPCDSLSLKAWLDNRTGWNY
ncbi:MAG TPA: hypothetical protein PKM97_03710, partial [Bacteroidia bacterium]|nr:hypothetical protein [Bacteroidia bacterium]